MLKQTVVKLVLAIALLAGGVGLWDVVADPLGLPTVSATYACPDPSGSGGGC